MKRRGHLGGQSFAVEKCAIAAAEIFDLEVFAVADDLSVLTADGSSEQTDLAFDLPAQNNAIHIQRMPAAEVGPLDSDKHRHESHSNREKPKRKMAAEVPAFRAPRKPSGGFAPWRDRPAPSSKWMPSNLPRDLAAPGLAQPTRTACRVTPWLTIKKRSYANDVDRAMSFPY